MHNPNFSTLLRIGRSLRNENGNPSLQKSNSTSWRANMAGWFRRHLSCPLRLRCSTCGSRSLSWTKRMRQSQYVSAQRLMSASSPMCKDWTRRSIDGRPRRPQPRLSQEGGVQSPVDSLAAIRATEHSRWEGVVGALERLYRHGQAGHQECVTTEGWVIARMHRAAQKAADRASNGNTVLADG
jgi:hypothetical protein